MRRAGCNELLETLNDDFSIIETEVVFVRWQQLDLLDQIENDLREDYMHVFRAALAPWLKQNGSLVKVNIRRFYGILQHVYEGSYWKRAPGVIDFQNKIFS